jgi:hypothetical protein
MSHDPSHNTVFLFLSSTAEETLIKFSKGLGTYKKLNVSWAWWYMLVIPVFRKQRQEDHSSRPAWVT